MDPPFANRPRSQASWLDWPRGPLLSLILILLVSLPGVFTGWVADDLIHHEMLAGRQGSVARTADMAYCFSGGPKQVPPLKWEPWWRNPQLRICYFRPLSSLTLAMDHRFLAQHPGLAHLHGLMWFLLACGGVYFLARALLDPRTATVASFVYGTSTAAFTGRVWIAARHASVAAAFTVVGLALYVSARERQQALRSALGLAVLACGLLGGEGALGGTGFVIAYELVRSRDPLRRRLTYAGVATGLALAFVYWYAQSGFGTAGSGEYLDPMREPGAFLAALPVRLLTLLSQAVLGIPSGPWMLPPLHPILPISGAVSLALLTGAIVLRRRELGEQHLRTLRFLALGALMAAAPASTAVLGGRVLMIPGIGLSILLAAALPLQRSGFPQRFGWQRMLARSVAVVLAACLLVVHPIIDLGQLYVLRLTEQAESRLAGSSLAGCAAAQRFLVLGTNEVTVGWYAPYLLADTIGERRWDQLSLATGELEVTRTGPRSLCLRARRGQVLGGMLYKGFGPRQLATDGPKTVAIPGASIRIAEADKRGVQSLCLELSESEAASADDARYCWLRYDGTHLVPTGLPAVGASLAIPYVKGPLTDS